VTVFAYECPNDKLAFFDFAVHSRRFPDFTASLICTLNQALLGLARKDETTLLIVDQPRVGDTPVIFQTQEDTLLIYIYLLSRWATVGSDNVDTFTKYSDPVFSRLEAFHFDTDFLDSIIADQSVLKKARACFEGNASESLQHVYIFARGQIGLS
jgi:hypothetical protein